MRILCHVPPTIAESPASRGKPPALRIFFHDRCFDGATSAALFAEFYRVTQDFDGAIAYWGMAHALGDPFSDVPFDAGAHACVDFRYCQDARMTWWFDHHQSAFSPPALREVFVERENPLHFYDPSARSCALFVQRVLSDKLSFEVEDPEGHWRELLTWADKIDGAVFESAAEIVELREPALLLMTWLRHNRNAKNMSDTIERMGKRSIAEMIRLPWIETALPTLLAAHNRGVALVAQHVELRGCVAVYDLLEEQIEAHSGFAAYLHCPEAIYSVGITGGGEGVSISVGKNPWAAVRGTKNIAEICERYGGGGHASVGGISLPAGSVARGREVVVEITALLDLQVQAER